MSEIFEAAIVVFFIGMISFLYGEKVGSTTISNLMGLITMISVLVLTGLAVSLAFV